MTENSVPYLSPAQLADAMGDPEAAGETASARLEQHYAKPTAAHRSFLYASLIAGSFSPGSARDER